MSVLFHNNGYLWVFKALAGSVLERAFNAAAKFLNKAFLSFAQFGICPGGIGGGNTAHQICIPRTLSPYLRSGDSRSLISWTAKRPNACDGPTKGRRQRKKKRGLQIRNQASWSESSYIMVFALTTRLLSNCGPSIKHLWIIETFKSYTLSTIVVNELRVSDVWLAGQIHTWYD